MSNARDVKVPVSVRASSAGADVSAMSLKVHNTLFIMPTGKTFDLPVQVNYHFIEASCAGCQPSSVVVMSRMPTFIGRTVVLLVICVE